MMNINNVSKPNPNQHYNVSQYSIYICIYIYLYTHIYSIYIHYAQYTHSRSLPSHGDGKGDVQLPFRKRPCDDDRDDAMGLCNATLEGGMNSWKKNCLDLL